MIAMILEEEVAAVVVVFQPSSAWVIVEVKGHLVDIVLVALDLEEEEEGVGTVGVTHGTKLR